MSGKSGNGTDRSDDEYECPDDDCDYAGPAGTRDYYGAQIYVCRRCGREMPEADPDRIGGGRDGE